MKKLFVLLLSAGVMATACRKEDRCIRSNGNTTTVTRAVNEFHSISLNGSYDVILTQSETQELKIEGASNVLPEITTEVINGKLVVDHDQCIRDAGKITIYASMKNLQSVELNGSGDIETANTFSVQDLVLYINGSGDMNIKATAKHVDARINGSGDIELHGSSESQKLSVNGSGNIHSFNMATKTAEAIIEGSGNIEVNASEELHARISGSGNIIYMGSPERFFSNSTGSGTVKRR